MDKRITEIFGSMVFNDDVMRERLPKEVYKSLTKTIATGRTIDPSIADTVANAMKDWAVEKGATHYTHWFQPLTGVTAEKHDAFIAPVGTCKVVMEFSGKELISRESDASSFPSGGLRATFEARGYTAWDPGSYAFVKDGTLYIPTAFCSYTGEALDSKTPLLRSMDALNTQALRILRLFGDTQTKRVDITVGAEQEYFIVDKKLYDRRKDLVYTGRTLFGAPAPKGQELEDHYFGPLKTRIAAFMSDLDMALWTLGVNAKTKHNEAAPAQHELAPVFTTANEATDHNQLTMEIMKKVAEKHGLACLLHEKPFAGVNGSGKHNNWALSTDTGINLFEPGDTPEQNAQFLLFLCAVIKAVDDYQELLRSTVASAGNDHRLGANEAPPAVVSIFVGDELGAILDSIEQDKPYDKVERRNIQIGVDALPAFPRDTTDRNRTSPFAFTGNKFEFRMLGSSMSAADTNTVLNTIVADALCSFADVLEKAEDLNAALHKLIRDTICEHKRIIFNGNGYDESWMEEAARRGLANNCSTDTAVLCMTDEKNVRLMERFGVLTATELHSRREIMLENYCKQISIEARVMSEMFRCDILPAAVGFARELADAVNAKAAVKTAVVPARAETQTLVKVSELCDEAYDRCAALDAALAGAAAVSDMVERAHLCREKVVSAMEALRVTVDTMETLVSKERWPYPSYGRLLNRV